MMLHGTMADRARAATGRSLGYYDGREFLDIWHGRNVVCIPSAAIAFAFAVHSTEHVRIQNGVVRVSKDMCIDIVCMLRRIHHTHVFRGMFC